ncbi:MAG TPA: T9SS type A sorting domain-containing protein [Cytophagaceae bacterium]
MKLKTNNYVFNCTLFFCLLLIAGGCTEATTENAPIVTQNEIQPIEQKPPLIKKESNYTSSVISVPQTNTKLRILKTEEKEDLRKKIPLAKLFHSNTSFVENKGQLEKFNGFSLEGRDVKFYSKAFGGTAYFTKDRVVFGFIKQEMDDVYDRLHPDYKPKKIKKREAIGLEVQFVDANKDVTLSGNSPFITKYNYFNGTENHITDISGYEQVQYSEIYKNIDLVYYLKDKELKYDFVVNPGGDIRSIKMQYDGAKSLSINKKGELEIETEWGILLDKTPFSYQVINGVQKEVKVRFKKLKNNQIGFEATENYNKKYPLIIDPPTMAWSTFVGGADAASNGYLHDVAVDVNGNIYGTGWYNDRFPIVGGVDAIFAGDEAIVFKLDPSGTTLIYASFLGGSAIDIGWGIAVNNTGEAFITGTTTSVDFPTSGTPVKSTNAGGTDIFVSRLNAAGNALIYSTYYGGAEEDRAFGIAINDSDEAYVTGSTNSAAGISTAGSYQTALGGLNDVLLLKLNSSGSAAIFCTYYGGAGDELGRAIAVNPTDGDAYIVGATNSSTGIATAGSFDNTLAGTDGFVARFNSTGTTLVYGAYIGGVGGADHDKAEDVVVKPNGEAIVAGYTTSYAGAGGFPVVNAYQANNGAPAGGPRDTYMMRISPDGSTLLNSTFYGTAVDDNNRNGSPLDFVVQHRSVGVDVNAAGYILLGFTTDAETGTLTMYDPVDASYNGGGGGLGDAFAVVFEPDGKTPIFNTYLGGSGHDYVTSGVLFDPSGDCIYVTGSNHSDETTFPTTAGAYRTTRGANLGADQGFITKYCTILPVEFGQFEVSATSEMTVLVEWTTLSEKNNRHFIVQRSTDGARFEDVDIVLGAGNTHEPQSYRYVDKNPYSGTSYYRIVQVDFDGKSSSSSKRSVTVKLIGQIYLAPNPASDMVTIKTQLNEDSELYIVITNILGQELASYYFDAQEGTFEYMIDVSSFSKGMYTVKMMAENEVATETLIRQ